VNDKVNMYDAQQALSFLVSQTTHIEPQVYRVQYPDIQYPSLVPIDSSANEWSKSVTFFSQDMVGQAQWFSAFGQDVPNADVDRTKFERPFHMAAIGYQWTVEELGVAALIPGMNLPADRAIAAFRAYQEFMDRIALYGDTTKQLQGLLNNTDVTAGNVALNAAGTSRTWATKAPTEILTDVNALLTGVYTGTLGIELCDTLLIGLANYTLIASQPRSTQIEGTTLDFIQKYNVYTAQTGQPLTIKMVRGLETAGAGSTGRIVAYRRAPDVVKLHMPMPHKFLPPFQVGPLLWSVPGIFRTGGVEIRRPGAFRYGDGV
jgi:hypothetical protein